MIYNPHAVARLAKNLTQTTVTERADSTVYFDFIRAAKYPDTSPNAMRNPIVLVPIAWGKPDRALASVVRNSIGCATPATVIPWAPGQSGLRRRLRSMHVHTDIDDQPVAHVHRFVSVEGLK